jgi:hypothetical protein
VDRPSGVQQHRLGRAQSSAISSSVCFLLFFSYFFISFSFHFFPLLPLSQFYSPPFLFSYFPLPEVAVVLLCAPCRARAAPLTPHGGPSDAGPSRLGPLPAAIAGKGPCGGELAAAGPLIWSGLVWSLDRGP